MNDVHVTDYYIDVWIPRWHWVGWNFRDLKRIAPIQRAQVLDAAAVIHHHGYFEGINAWAIAEQNVKIIPCHGQCPYTVHAELKTEGRILIIVLAIRYSTSLQSHPSGLTLDLDIEEHLVTDLSVETYAYQHISRLRQFIGQSNVDLRNLVLIGQIRNRSDELDLQTENSGP